MPDMGVPPRHPSKGAVHYPQAELLFKQWMIKLIADKGLSSDHSHFLREQEATRSVTPTACA